MAPIPAVLTSVLRVNGLSKEGYARTGQMSVLLLDPGMTSHIHYSTQTRLLFVLISACSGFAILVTLGTNLHL